MPRRRLRQLRRPLRRQPGKHMSNSQPSLADPCCSKLMRGTTCSCCLPDSGHAAWTVAMVVQRMQWASGRYTFVNPFVQLT